MPTPREREDGAAKPPAGAGSRRPDVGIIGMVPDRWDAPWMPRHHVMSRLADRYQVVWLHPAPHWRDADGRPFGRPGPDPAGPIIYRGGLPAFHRPAALARAAFRARVRAAARLLERRGAERLVLYLWRPAFDLALDARPWDLVCYHVDDEYTFSPDDPPVPEREARLLREADQVFIHSPALLEKKGSFNRHTVYVPNGVDFAAFSAPVPEPADLAGIPRPRIGYTGMLKRQLDWPMLLDLTRRHPEWQFVFVGARSPHPELEPIFAELEGLPNAHLLGPKPVEELSRYPQHFDVCIMPYRVDGYTRYIYPMKLHEYLATGRPVVGSPIRTLREFDHVIALAGDVDAWSDALGRSLRTDAGPAAAAARRAVARAHDWDLLVGRIVEAIEERLAAPAEPHTLA